MKRKWLLATVLLGVAIPELASAEEIDLTPPSQRLLAIAGIPKNEVEAFLKCCQRQHSDEAPEAGSPRQVIRKWSFGERVSTLTEVKLFGARVLIANWVVKKSGKTTEEWECFKSYREFGPDVAAELKKYAETQFEDPLPVSMSTEFDYKSSTGFDLVEELQRRDGESVSWAIRTPFLIKKNSYEEYTQQTLRIAQMLNLPSF